MTAPTAPIDAIVLPSTGSPDCSQRAAERVPAIRERLAATHDAIDAFLPALRALVRDLSDGDDDLEAISRRERCGRTIGTADAVLQRHRALQRLVSDVRPVLAQLATVMAELDAVQAPFVAAVAHRTAPASETALPIGSAFTPQTPYTADAPLELIAATFRLTEDDLLARALARQAEKQQAQALPPAA